MQFKAPTEFVTKMYSLYIAGEKRATEASQDLEHLYSGAKGVQSL